MKTATLFALAILMCLCSCGCGRTFWGQIFELSTPEPPPNPHKIVAQYDSIEVRQSGAADVLSVIHLPDHELLSQSKSVIATAGTVKKGYKRWMKMAAFDENGMEVQRKYLVIANESPRYLFVSPWTGVLVDMEMVIESEVIDEPYANENARRIAILERVKEYAAQDVLEVAQDNKEIETAGLLINEGLSSALSALASSPAMAEKLTDAGGMVYDDVTLDQGRMTLEVVEDVVTTRMRLGSYSKCRIVLPPTDQY